MIRIKVNAPDGNTYEKEYGSPVTPEQIVQDIPRQEYDIVACCADNEYMRISTPVEHDCVLDLFDMRNAYANLVYQNSMILLYLRAVHDLYGYNTRVSIRNSLSRGIFTRIHVSHISDEDCTRIAKRMRELVDEDAPIEERYLTRDEAIELFREKNNTEGLRLFESAPDLKDILWCSLGKEEDIFSMHSVPSCRYLQRFEIRRYRNGVLVRFPHHRRPDQIPEYSEQRILYDAFSEEIQWETLMGINYASDLNRRINRGDYRDLVLLSEALHEKKIAQIAEKIHTSGKRIILIAGPSSSGKTSFARRLCIQLRVIGLHPLYLGTDDYFLNRDEMEVDENGNRDFESLSAVDVALFTQQMNDLLAGKKVDIPEFDFIDGVKIFGKRMTSIRSDQPIVIEGIHGLNPDMTRGINDDDKFRIYISPLTQLNIDSHHRIPTTDARLFRRLVRDHRTRGRSAAVTIRDWPAVRAGEDNNIFPYNEEADAFFNSHCLYEFAALKKYAQPLLEEITQDMPEYPQAQRFLKMLEFFAAMDDESAISSNSIIREFIGGSVLVN